MAKRLKSNHLSFWLPLKNNKVDATDSKPPNKRGTFQESMRITLLTGQIFSLLPVHGAWSKQASHVNFKWSSWKCCYLFISWLGQFFITIMCVHKVVHSTTSLNGTSPIIFYGTTCITMLMFLRVATMWPDLVQHIARIEEMDPNTDSNLTFKCNTTCAVVLTSALLEHILSLLSAIAEAMVCRGDESSYKGFVKNFYPWVFNYIPYSLVLGIFTQFLHFQSTFIWNFSDLFVICMSYYLTSRLDHVNKKLLTAQGKLISFLLHCTFIIYNIFAIVMSLVYNHHPTDISKERICAKYLPEIFWRTSREDYGRAVQLVRRVDEVISGVIFISFANNLFFICLQLFNTLEDGIKGSGHCSSRAKGKNSPFSGYEAAVYFLFSLIYLITRSVAVSLIASQVNTASTVPAPVLYDVPSPVYCVEVQRFLDQVNGNKVALSGLQFFSITRGLLLTVAGTIVTYELVMFQFNGPQATDTSTAVTTPSYNTTTTSTF